LANHDEAAARESFRIAADAGNSQAMVLLGAMYAQGRGGPKSDPDAVYWFRQASELGNPRGMYNLGLMYEAGRGVPKDLAEARRYYLKSGTPEAKTRLANMPPP
jgi:hypothetical protein